MFAGTLSTGTANGPPRKLTTRCAPARRKTGTSLPGHSYRSIVAPDRQTPSEENRPTVAPTSGRGQPPPLADGDKVGGSSAGGGAGGVRSHAPETISSSPATDRRTPGLTKSLRRGGRRRGIAARPRRARPRRRPPRDRRRSPLGGRGPPGGVAVGGGG